MKVHIKDGFWSLCGNVPAADGVMVDVRLAECVTCQRCIAGLRKAARVAGTRPLVATS